MAEILGSAHVTAEHSYSETVQMIQGEFKAPPTLVSLATMAALITLSRESPEGGCFVEIGVYKGGTAYHLAKVAREQGRRIYLYDTFEGIPCTNKEKGDQHKIGDFNDARMQDVVAAIPDAITIKGYFPASMIPMPPIAFCHIDADQYDSIIDSCRAIEGLMMAGGIVVFDDYGCLEGATRAVDEYYGKSRIEMNDAGKAMVRY